VLKNIHEIILNLLTSSGIHASHIELNFDAVGRSASASLKNHQLSAAGFDNFVKFRLASGFNQGSFNENF